MEVKASGLPNPTLVGASNEGRKCLSDKERTRKPRKSVHSTKLHFLRSRNPIARKVKLADLEHNLDLTRFDGCVERLLYGYDKRKGKYESAREFLLEAEEGGR